MTKKEKELLSKDLCARLYYGIKGLHRGQVHILKTMDWGYDRMSIKVDGYDAWFPIDSFKPYLRSMSSMTEEEKKEYHKQVDIDLDRTAEALRERFETGTFHPENRFTPQYCHIDWLNANHFDYCGLIEKGLALEAPEGMYK